MANAKRPSQLWQMPLLLVSLGLFAFAAFLLIPRAKAPTLDDRITAAEAVLQKNQLQPAGEELQSIRDTGKLTPEQDGRVHMLQAAALQGSRKTSALEPEVHQQILDHLKLALKCGVHPDADIHRRLAESSEAVGRVADALDHYKLQLELDPAHPLAIRQKIIALELASRDDAAVEHSLQELLEDENVHGTDRAAALGELSRIEADRGEFKESNAHLDEAIKADTEAAARGPINFRKGYCEWKLGHVDDAERLFRAARDQLKNNPPQNHSREWSEMDAKAGQLIGRILQDKKKPEEAKSFYESIIRDYPDSLVAPLARLGRGVCRIELSEDLSGINDLQDTVRDIQAKESRAIFKSDAITALRRASDKLSETGNLHGALEVLELEHTLTPDPPADFFLRLAGVFDKRAEDIGKTIDSAATEADKQNRRAERRQYLVRAGDARLSFARAVTVSNDAASGEELWKAVDRYDKAGDLDRTLSALEMFTNERPSDPRTPDAMLKLGLTARAAGLFDRAIKAFQDNQFYHPQSIAASKSGVPLAQAYVAKGPEFYPKAEKALQATLESELITPEAEDFKDALFELAKLHYRTERYEAAVARLEELNERYPRQERLGQVLFLMADSYRKSSILLKDNKTPTAGLNTLAASRLPASPTTNPTTMSSRATRAEIEAARHERLEKARRLYDRLVEIYKDSPPTTDLDRLYLKLAYLYRADCLYDNGNFEESVRMYDAAALRYQEDPWALAAYVQIVNAYLALGRTGEARTANERAKWLLRRMPDKAFKDSEFSIPRRYWEDWLQWSSASGIW